MLNLFKIEWLKIKTYRTFWVLFAGFLVFFPAAFYLTAYKYMETMANARTVEENVLKALLEAPFVFRKFGWQRPGWEVCSLC